MEKSKSLAKLVGPTLTVMIFSEMKLWNPTLYDTQIVPVVYLNGVLLFVAGLAILKTHHIWILGWQSILTLVGYFGIILGLFRMLFPQVQQGKFENNTSILVIELVLLLVGLFLTFKAYTPIKK